MFSFFAFYIFTFSCADRISELRNKLLLAPEFTVTNSKIEKLDYGRIYQIIEKRKLKKNERWYKHTSLNKFKKRIPLSESISIEMLRLIKYLVGSGSFRMLDSDSSFITLGRARFSLKPVSVQISNSKKIYHLTAEYGAFELNQYPHKIEDLNRNWKKPVTDIFNMGFIGTTGWAISGGGTNINIGSDFDQISIFKEYPQLLFRLYTLVFFHPGILFHLDEFGQHADAKCPLWEMNTKFLKRDILKISDQLRACDQSEVYKESVLALRRFLFYLRDHFICFKCFDDEFEENKSTQPYVEVRFNRSVQSFEELEALEYFWLHTFAYLIDNEPSESKISFQSLDEIPIPSLTKDFESWMADIELPQKYQKILMELGGARVGDPLSYKGPEIPFDLYLIPGREFGANYLGIHSKNNKKIFLNGSWRSNYLKLSYNSSSNSSSTTTYRVRAAGSEVIYNIIIRETRNEWPRIETRIE